MSTCPSMRAFKLANPTGLYDPSANGYSHLAVVEAGARLVFVSGQGGEADDGSLPRAFRGQVRQAFDNLAIAARAGGAGIEDVFKITALVVDHDESKLGVLTEEIDRAFGPGMKPACTLIPVPRLALVGMLFEVEGVAAVRPSARHQSGRFRTDQIILS